MQCGLFTELQCPEERQESQLYDELLEQITQAEALGFEAMWMAELHFHRRFSILSAPLLTAAAAAQRTQRLRLGIAVNLLPASPRQAGRGRGGTGSPQPWTPDFGVGRGHRFPASMTTFISHRRRAGALRGSARHPDRRLDVRTLQLSGRLFSSHQLAVVPKPVQQPHPPIFVAAGSPETYTATGQRGLGILVPGHVQPMEALRENLANYWEAGRTARHEERLQVTFLIPMYVAEHQHQAEAEPEPHVMYYYSVLGELLSGEFPESYQRYGESRRRLGTLSYDTIRRERAIFGEPFIVLNAFTIFARCWQQQIMAWMNIGGMPHDKVYSRCGCLPSGCCRPSNSIFHLLTAALRSGVMPASKRRPYMSQTGRSGGPPDTAIEQWLLDIGLDQPEIMHHPADGDGVDQTMQAPPPFTTQALNHGSRGGNGQRDQ